MISGYIKFTLILLPCWMVSGYIIFVKKDLMSIKPKNDCPTVLQANTEKRENLSYCYSILHNFCQKRENLSYFPDIIFVSPIKPVLLCCLQILENENLVLLSLFISQVHFIIQIYLSCCPINKIRT